MDSTIRLSGTAASKILRMSNQPNKAASGRIPHNIKRVIFQTADRHGDLLFLTEQGV